MRKSKRLRFRDLRNIYRLIGECRDLGADLQAWYSHLLAGAGRLVGGPVATGGHVEGWSRGEPRPLLVLDMGWADPRGQQLFRQWVAAGDAYSDLLYSRMCQLRRPLLTQYRRQVVSDEEWYASPLFNEYQKLCQVDDCVYSVVHLPQCDLTQSVSLHRAPDDRPFGEWERRVVHWLHYELAPLLGRQLATAQDPPFRLAPRLRQTLDCLLEGDSEKQIALRLGLSRQTIHDYVKALYRHFDVSSRGELLALWVRRPSSGACSEIPGPRVARARTNQ